MPRKLISIIGSSSFLSSNLTSLLRQKDVVVHGYSRRDNNPNIDVFHHFDYPNSLPNLRTLCKSDVIIYAAGNGIQANQKVADLEILNLNTYYPINLMTSLNSLDYKGQFLSLIHI